MRKIVSVLGVLVFVGAFFAIPASAGEVVVLADQDLDRVLAGETPDDVGSYVDNDAWDIDDTNYAYADEASTAKVEDRGISIDDAAQKELMAVQNQNVSSGGDVGQALVMGEALKNASGQVLEVGAGSQTKTGVNVATLDVATLGTGGGMITQIIDDPMMEVSDDGLSITADSIEDNDMVDLDDVNAAIGLRGSTATVEDRRIHLDNESQSLLSADQNQNVSSAGDVVCKGDVGQAEMRGEAAKNAQAQVLQVLAGSQSMTAVNVATGYITTCGHGELSIYQRITFTQ